MKSVQGWRLPFKPGDVVTHPDFVWTELQILSMTIDNGYNWTAAVTALNGGGYWLLPASELQLKRLANGTEVCAGPSWCVTKLPCGDEIHAHTCKDSIKMAQELGYEQDVDTLTREHDALHSILMDWLGQPYSYSLMRAAGHDVNQEIAWYEEDAVLKLQNLINALKKSS